MAMMNPNPAGNNYNYPNPTPEQSAEFRERIDVNLAGYLLKLKRRWKLALAVFLLTVGATAALSLLLKESFAAQGKLLFKQDNTSSLVGLDEKGVGELQPLLNNQTPLSTQIEIITSDPVLQQTIDQLQLQDDEGKPLSTKALEEKLNIGLVGGSDVVEIAYSDEDPQVAASVVNTLMDVYIEEQIRSIQAEPASAKEFINKQLPQIESRVATAESELREFKEANDVVNLDKESETVVVQLAELNRQIADVGSEYQGVKAQAEALGNQIGLNLDQALAADQLGGSPVIQGILTELGNVESELANERQRFRDKHPSIISLEDKKAALNEQLQGQIRRKVGQGANISEGLLNSENGMKENQLEKYINLEIDGLRLQRQLASLYESQKTQLGRAKQLPRLQKEEQDLVRKVEAAQATYTTLLSSLQQVQIAQNQQTGNAQVIEIAQTPQTGSTGRLAFLAVGVVLGLLLSNLSVILVEMQDRTLKSMVEIKQSFPFTVLGMIPKDSEEHAKGVVVQQQPDSFTSEIYRMIQANLKFLTLKQSPKVILLTSSVPGEGKSTVSANLAAAIAQLGRRVLLIDGDLRNPSQHRIWNANNNIGLKDVLSTQIQLKSAVFRPLSHLEVLPGGKIVSNPLALLDSTEMSYLVARARQEYDLVLIDAPPLPVTADVLTISKMVDGILFVSRPGIVDQESAALARETLATTGQQVLGMVINGISAKEFDRYSYHAKYAKRYFQRRDKDHDNHSNGNPNSNGKVTEAGMENLKKIS